ncbi:hypothetical protein R6Q57_007986 [Mikania cordata]
MGNCIIRQNKIKQIGQEFNGHKESMKVDHEQVLGGHMYHRVPLPKPSMEFNKIPEIDAVSEGGDRVVRIKLVITKHELEMMLRKGGVSVSDLGIKESTDEDNRSCGRWKPVLASIPELN